MPLFSPSIEARFALAGWLPRDPAPLLSHSSSARDRAAAQIQEFCGLRVGNVGPGRDLAASDVHFYSQLRPVANVVAREWAPDLGEIEAFATAHHDHMIVLIDSQGAFYAFADPDDSLYSIVATLNEAMERLMLGHDYGAKIVRPQLG
ncbi:hypothetical protein D9M72_509970 [compost metagenome]